MKKSKRLPSRIKYENDNPTVSARLPKEKRDRLFAILIVLKMTLTQLLLHFIGEYEPKITPVEEAYKFGYREGFRDGFARAEEIFAIKYICSQCGKEGKISLESEKKAIRKFLDYELWAHDECVPNINKG